MKTVQRHSPIYIPFPNVIQSRLWRLGAVICSAAATALGQTVTVESRSGGQNYAWYADGNGAPAANWGNSSAKSSAPGTTPGIGSRYCPTTDTPDVSTTRPSITVRPTLPVAGGRYLVEVTHVSPNCSPNIVVAISQIGCSGLPESTTVFQQAGANTWEVVGTMTLDPGTNTPTIRFEYLSGNFRATGNRWYSDAIRFTYQGGTATWDGGGTDDNWTTPANWVNDTAPSLADSIIFAGSTRTMPRMDTNFTVSGVTFSSDAAPFSVSADVGWSLTFSSGAISNLSANPQFMDMPIILAGAHTIHAGQDITLGGDIHGSGGFAKTGPGTLTLTGDAVNTFSGGATLNDGTIVMDKLGALSLPGNITINGGTLRNLQDEQIADGAGVRVTVKNAGTWDLNGHTERVGTVESATTDTGAVVALGAGTLTVWPTISGSYNLAVGKSGFYGNITGTAGSRLIMEGTGEYRLHKSGNSFEQLIVRNGLLRAGFLSGFSGESIFGAVPAAPKADAIVLEGGSIGASFGAVLHTNRGITVNAAGGTFDCSAATFTIPGVITGPGGLHKWGAQNLVLAGNNDFAGGLTISGGPVYFDHDHAAGPGVITIIATNSAVTLRKSDDDAVRVLTNAIVVNAGLDPVDILVPSGDTLVFSGPISGPGGLYRGRGGGAGRAILAADNSGWSGGLEHRGGGLALGHRLALGTGPLTVTGLQLSTTELEATVPLTGPDALTNALVLATNLVIGGENPIEFAGPVTLAGGVGDMRLLNVTNPVVVFSAPVDCGGEVGLIKRGAGTLVINSNLGPTAGGIVVSNGTLAGVGEISGDVTIAPGGTLSPGSSVGTLTIYSNLTLAGTTVIEVHKAGGVLFNDFVKDMVLLTCGGTLRVTASGEPPAYGDFIVLFQALQFAGQFAAFDLSPLPDGLAWDVSLVHLDGSLGIQHAPRAGEDSTNTLQDVAVSVPLAVLLVNDGDPDGDPVSITNVSAASAQGGVVTLAGGDITYTPPTNYFGPDSFTYTLIDGRGGVAIGTVTVRVDPANVPAPRVLAGPTLAGGRFQVRFAGVPNQPYSIHTSTNVTGPWNPLTNLNSGPTGEFDLLDPVGEPPPPQRYYRTKSP